MKSVIVLNGDYFTHVRKRDDWNLFSAPTPFLPSIFPSKTIKKALEEPDGTEPLHDLLRKSKRVVVAFDDISVPFPPMLSDVRKVVLQEIMKMIRTSGIERENVTLLCATGLHRRCLPGETRHILGKTVWREWIDRVRFHREKDAVWIGDTSEGERVEINKILLEADLVIYISIVFLPMNGGWKSIIIGTGSFQSILASHNPEVISKDSYMDPESSFHKIITRMGKVAEEKINLFKIEIVLSNLFLPPVEEVQNLVAKVPLTSEVLNRLPDIIRKTTINALKGWYPLYSVYTGNVDKIHRKAIRDVKNQLTVYHNEPKLDVMLFGVPNLSPYSLNSTTNPILIHTLVNGYLYNMFGKALRKNGVIIFWNPLEEKFDLEKHLSYAFLYSNYLPLDCSRRKDIEELLWKNRDFYQLYNNGFGYHGLHALLAWYWGCKGKSETSAQIAIGGNPYVAEKLGMLTANNIMEALEEAARYTSIKNIGFFIYPPIFLIG